MFSAATRAFSTASAPYRILGVQQIAIGGGSLDALTSLWSGAFQANFVKSFQSESENVDENVMTVGKGKLGTIEVDLMTALDSAKKPNPSSPALNHLGLWVDDLAACYSHMESQGFVFTPGGIRKGAAGHDICFLHPKPKAGKGGEGVLIELVQAPPDVIEAWEKA
jgi:lactoylglutathione lyase